MSSVVVLCTDEKHPIVPMIWEWRDRQRGKHEVNLVHRVEDAEPADVLFLVSCHDIVPETTRAGFIHAMVLHASDLPRGRGWSPHVWEILAGEENLTVSLIEAADPVDSGAILAQERLLVPRHALHEEINHLLFEAELRLMDRGLELCASGCSPRSQQVDGASWYPRRRPADSEIDPHRSISEQFDLLRVADPDRYPAFFRLHGHKYAIKLWKIDDE